MAVGGQSFVDVEFWSELGKRKLNDLRLSEEAIPLRGALQSLRFTT